MSVTNGSHGQSKYNSKKYTLTLHHHALERIYVAELFHLTKLSFDAMFPSLLLTRKFRIEDPLESFVSNHLQLQVIYTDSEKSVHI